MVDIAIFSQRVSGLKVTAPPRQRKRLHRIRCWPCVDWCVCKKKTEGEKESESTWVKAIVCTCAALYNHCKVVMLMCSQCIMYKSIMEKEA